MDEDKRPEDDSEREGDQEVLALRSNPEFMAWLSDRQRESREGPTKTFEEVARRFGFDAESFDESIEQC